MIERIIPSLRSRRLRVRTALCIASIASLIAAVSVARAQAVYTADRVNGFSVFGAFSELDTDYGAKDRGYLVGGDLTHSIRFHVITPSVELRYTGSSSPAITESSFSGGLKIEHAFHRFHPYADAMIGYGSITYVPYHQGDNSIIYGVGVGLDYNVMHQFAVKIDAHEQFWKLGQATSELTPQSVSVGILWRLPTSFRRNQ
jgi:hypothetical protein